MLRNAKKSVEGSGSRELDLLAPPAPEATFSPEGTAGAPRDGSGRAGCGCAVACVLPWAEESRSRPLGSAPRASEARRRGEGARAPRELATEEREEAPRVVARAQQIVRTKAESQRIVATRPLCRVQYPVPYSSRLQVIHRPGSVNCDRSRLRQCYRRSWRPRAGGALSFRHGF